MRQKLNKILLILGLLLGPVILRGAALPPVVLNIFYTCGDPVIHIGSKMTVYMSVVSPTNTYSVSVTTSAPGNLLLGSSTFSALPAQTLFVTDGIRAWSVNFPGFVPTLSISDTELLLNTPVFNNIDYTTIANNSFRVYSGTLVRSSTAGSPSVNVDVGTFDNQDLSDALPINPSTGDAVGDDGVWTGIYNVRELGFSVFNGKFFGLASLSGQFASNSPFQSVVSFSLDGIRPQIDFYTFNASNTNYAGRLYLSALSQGSTTFQPTNAQGRFDVTVNKRGTIVDISIGTTPVKNLPPIYIPPNATTLNGFKAWTGQDGVGLYVDDGPYPVTLSIRDENGVTGTAKLTSINVTSLRMKIDNVVLSPAAVSINQIDTSDTVDDVSYSYKITLDNEAGTPITNALDKLGWTGGHFGPATVFDPATGTNVYSCVTCTITVDKHADLLFPDGSLAVAFKGHNIFIQDTDAIFLNMYRGDPYHVPLPGGAYGLTCTALGTTHTAGVVVSIEDGNISNDWDDIIPGFSPVLGTSTDPIKMEFTGGGGYAFTAASPGSLRLQVRVKLTGMDRWTSTADATTADVVDLCDVSPTAKFLSRKINFAPHYGRGGGLIAEDSSLLFSIYNTPPPTSDTTPPLLVSTDPQDNTTFGPGIYGPANPITVQVQDPESQINIANGTTFIKLIDPTGSFVGGNSTTNGGGANNTATVTFTPFLPMILGGDYEFQITACNQNGLCIQKNQKFTVQDQTPPSVTGAELVTNATCSNQPLTIQQTSPDGLFSNITEVWATLSMPSSSSNTIDWDASNITLQELTSTANVFVPLTRITPLGTVPTDSKLKYRLNSTLTRAGLFRVIVQTFSKDSSGNAFTGPPSGFINPEFNTIFNTTALSIKYPNGTSEAVSGFQPLTVIVGVSTFTPLSANSQALLPNFSILPTLPGYLPLTSSTASAHGLRFNLNGNSSVFQPPTWYSAACPPLRFYLYFDNADLPASVTDNNNLRLCGFNGATWTLLTSGADYSSQLQNVTNNVYTILVSSGVPVYTVYGIFYSSTAPSLSGTATPLPTPYAFKATRSFNPASSNSLQRVAKFYYSPVAFGVAPREMEVKIYDTSGALVRSLSMGSGVSLANSDADPVYGGAAYYFSWDGMNDTNNLVKNGIYLVRWKLTKTDGTTDVQTKLVALIK